MSKYLKNNRWIRNKNKYQLLNKLMIMKKKSSSVNKININQTIII